MTFRNSTFVLATQIGLALLNGVLSLAFIASLTSWPMQPFALLFGLLFCTFSGFIGYAWFAEVFTLTPDALEVRFGFKGAQTRSFPFAQTTITLQPQTRWQRLFGWVQLDVTTADQHARLKLQMKRAQQLQQMMTQAHPWPQPRATQLRLRDLPPFLGLDSRFFAWALNSVLIILIGSLLIFPRLFEVVNLLVFLPLLLIASSCFWLGTSAVQWLQSRYRHFEQRDATTYSLTFGCFSPTLITFTTADIVRLSVREQRGRVSIWLTLDPQTTSHPKPLLVAHHLSVATYKTWCAQFFPELNEAAKRFVPVDTAKRHYLISPPLVLIIICALICLVVLPPQQIGALIIIATSLIASLFWQHQRVYRYNWLEQRDTHFVIGDYRFTPTISYYAKQHCQAQITRTKREQQAGLGTLSLTFPHHFIQTVRFPGIAQTPIRKD